MSDDRTLEVWQVAMELVRVDGATPSRCHFNPPSNIAESRGRFSHGDSFQLLCIARGSLAELETQIILAERLTYLNSDVVATLLRRCATVGRLLNGYMRYVKEEKRKQKPRDPRPEA